MNRRRRIYEGKAKILYEGPEPGTLIQFFKDDATAFNAKKHEIVDGKGVLNNRISEHIFTNLNRMGIPTHFIRRLNMREQLIKEVEIIPLEIVVRNIAAGSLATRLGIEEGTVLPRSIRTGQPPNPVPSMLLGQLATAKPVVGAWPLTADVVVLRPTRRKAVRSDVVSG